MTCGDIVCEYKRIYSIIFVRLIGAKLSIYFNLKESVQEQNYQNYIVSLFLARLSHEKYSDSIQ